MRGCSISRTKTTNLRHLSLFFPLAEYRKQSQLWHQSLDANRADASPSSERRKNLHNTGTGSHHQTGWRSAATMVGDLVVPVSWIGDLEVHVSWIVAWRNESSSLAYHCVPLRSLSRHQTILRRWAVQKSNRWVHHCVPLRSLSQHQTILQ